MTCHGWNASSSPIMSEIRWHIKFITKFLTLQLLKVLYSDVLLIGSNPVSIQFGAIRDCIKKNRCSFLRNSTCMYEVLACILMWMAIMLWCIYYFPGIQPCDLSANGGAKLFTGSCLAQADGNNLVSICPSERQWWGYSKLVSFTQKI